MAEEVYIYALVPRGTMLPAGLTGFRGDPLATVVCRDLAAVTSRVDGPVMPASAERVILHEEIVETIWRAGPSLPVRFGTVFPDAASVERALDRRYDALTADLTYLGDKLEFGLSVLWDTRQAREDPSTGQLEQADDAGGRGTAYLRARADVIRHEDAQRDSARALADKVEATLGRCALDRRTRLLPTERLALRIAYLVDPEREQAFIRAFEELRMEDRTRRFLLSGPWPPYTFVRREDSVASLTDAPQARTQQQAGSVETLSRPGAREEV